MEDKEEEKEPFKAQSMALPTGSILSTFGSRDANAVSKYAPEGLFRNDLFTGSAGYTYSIQVPSGVNGLEPSININYNSHQAASRGLLGSGWSLSADNIYRNIENTQSDASDDTYHIQISGMNVELVYVASEGKYHTKTESYMDIKRTGESWTVRTKDGMAYRFGASQNSRIESSLQPFTSIWSLEQIADTHGNSISYEYVHNSSSDKSAYLSRIIYGVNEIKFNYNFNAQNGFYGYAFGTQLRQTALLDSIEAMTNGNLARKYSFDYENIDSRKFLKRIRQFGSDGTSQLPPVEFSYYTGSGGWSEDNSWKLPSDVDLGSERDTGTRIFDINGDGYNDIMQIYGSANGYYWINNKNGWNSRQSFGASFPAGFADSNGNDQGVRLLDINGDTRIDLWQSTSGLSPDSILAVNTGNGWSQAGISAPQEAGFVEKKEPSVKCYPDYCPDGYSDDGTNCESGACTRTCSRTSCSGSGVVVRDGADKMLKWYDDYYEKSSIGTKFTPQPNKCYKFDFIGSSRGKEDDYWGYCYDLTVNRVKYIKRNGQLKNADYGKDCSNDPVWAHAGIGFKGNDNPESWMDTIPGSGNSVYISNPDIPNDKWRFIYLSKSGIDTKPKNIGDKKAEYRGLDHIICDKGGVNTIYCAPSFEACADWGKDQCGFGCANEGTAPYVVLGIYKSIHRNLNDAVNGYEPDCSDELSSDNDYLGEGTFTVTEYDASATYANQQCSFQPYEFISSGTALADLNADGRTDIIKAKGSDRRTWLRIGDGWQEAQQWQFSGRFRRKSQGSEDCRCERRRIA
ncbi:hypothetical protein HYX09_00705 [Candidatus Woesearchaeota archaeon]|nr:hypothetical protein [Candidatus Woesearchaeota archaeon]